MSTVPDPTKSNIPAKTIVLPCYCMRPYQQDLFNAICSKKYRRAVAVWHRRAGKDIAGLSISSVMAMQKPGNYWYVFPTYAQAKKAIWEGLDNDGDRIINKLFPKELRRHTDNQDMKIELKNPKRPDDPDAPGSFWQLVGADKFDNLLGSNPQGIVFSEYSIMNPSTWDFLSPILANNKGWAIFIYTPRGHNHGYRMWERAVKDERWFTTFQTVTDTGATELEEIEAARVGGVSEERIQQEYYCSWDTEMSGSYYGAYLNQAYSDKRITEIKWVPDEAVHTAWDIGVGDYCVIWFFQIKKNGQIHIIDYYEQNGKGPEHYAKVLKEKPYVYGNHYGPHDLRQRSFTVGVQKKWESLCDLGVKITILPKYSIDDGITMSRSILPRCWFDVVACKKGLEALEGYTKVYNETLCRFEDNPLHDWCSDAADAFRYLATAVKQLDKSRGGEQGAGRYRMFSKGDYTDENLQQPDYNIFNIFRDTGRRF